MAHKCYACGQETVIWSCDFSFEDYCIEGEGLVQEYTCLNCGASITYYIPFDTEEEPTDETPEKGKGNDEEESENQNP